MALQQDDKAWESWFDEYVPEDESASGELADEGAEEVPNLRSARWLQLGLAVLGTVLLLLAVRAVV